MSITSGSRLGPYEIVASIGAGGMGEVFKARDTRLDRSVAIKVLPAEFAQNAQLKMRFEREAKTISQLQHPNICTLFDVGENYLVMELLEGESLAQRLARGPLPLADVLRYGAEIAEALDRAHRAGIVHRDLKPGNVMITKSGAKLLDFGLAKSAVVDVSADGATVHKALTQEGTILGTFQYMAPEQLEGLEADARTDIFALGALLYEMLTGVRAFQGKNKTSLIGAIVSGEPRPVSAVQPLTPPALEHVIRKCLEKEPDDRWQSTHDIAGELRWISETGSQTGVAAPLVARRKTRQRILWSVAAVAGIALAIASYFAGRRTNSPSPFYRTSLVIPTSLDYYSGPMAISPDGKSVAYAASNEAGQRILWVRRFGETAPLPLPAAVDASAPFWSPDGQTLGYFTHRTLNRISASGGQPEVIAPAAGGGAGGTWNRKGEILFAPATDTPILRVAASGGEPVPITRLQGHRTHRWPHFLPDGKRFVFLALRTIGGKAQPGIYLASIDGKEEPKFLTSADSNAVLVEPDRLLFGREGILRVQRVDFDEGAMVGEPASIGPVQYSSRYAASMFSASADTLVYQEKGSEVLSALQWVDRQGNVLGSVGSPAYYWSPRLSRDGKRIAVDKSVSSGNGDIWILETTRPGATRFTLDESNESIPIWTTGDAALIYMINPQRAGSDVLIKSLSANSAPVRLVADPARQEYPADLSSDGRFLLLSVQALTESSHTGADIYAYSFLDKKVTPFLTSPATEDAPFFSPDGKWVVYVSDESGRNEIYVQSFPAPTSQWQISTSGGSMPRFAPNGREIYYVSADGKLMAVPVSTGESFEAGTASPLFAVRLREETTPQYDVSADGTRFLLNALAPRNDPPLAVLIHWQTRYQQ